MTAIARRTAMQPVHQNASHARRSWWSVLTDGTARVRAKLVALAAAGQLGPDPETEISRRTGGRV